MEENRTEISKSDGEFSDNQGHEGSDGSDVLPPSPSRNDTDDHGGRPLSVPTEYENGRENTSPPHTAPMDAHSSIPPSGSPDVDDSKGADKASETHLSPDSSIAYDPAGEDEILNTPPTNIPFTSTQMILGIDPTQPVLMPGRPTLSPEDEERINKYRKFQKVDGAAYRRVNQFLRKHTYVTAREWAIARLCADFSTRGGAEMTFIGENLPDLVPFMTDTYSPQAVNQARSSFKKKVRKSGATFFYGALCGFFTADELDDILFEASEVARFLLEVEGTSIDIDDEIDIEDRITEVMRGVAEAASRIRSEDPEPAETEDTDTEEDEI